ncbi:unnamed protein product [Brassica oleracea var. botrytis]
MKQQLYACQAWIFQAPSTYPSKYSSVTTQAPWQLPSSAYPTQSSSSTSPLQSSRTPLPISKSLSPAPYTKIFHLHSDRHPPLSDSSSPQTPITNIIIILERAYTRFRSGRILRFQTSGGGVFLRRNGTDQKAETLGEAPRQRRRRSSRSRIKRERTKLQICVT